MATSVSSLAHSPSSLSFSSHVSHKHANLCFPRLKSVSVSHAFNSPALVVSASAASTATRSETEDLKIYVKSRLPGGFFAQTFIGTGRRKSAIARVVLQEGTGKVIINYRDAKKGEDLDSRYARAALIVMAAMPIAPFNLCFFRIFSSSPSRPLPTLQPAFCVPIQDVQAQVDAEIACEPCNGRGWIVCDFCKGQKINVKSESSRMFRRCPSCRAVGYVLCSKCKVFKCVTFPNYNDGEDLSF